MRKTIVTAPLLALSLVLAAAACQKPHAGSPGANPESTTTASPVVDRPATKPPAAPGPAVMEVKLWYVVSGANRFYLAPERHTIPYSPAVAKAALDELVNGKPQDSDHVVGYSPKSRIRSVAIKNRIATVDWSAEVLREYKAGSEVEALGIQQVVYTLTEFPTIAEVRFTVEGKTRGKASNGDDIESWWGHVGLDGQPFMRADYMETVAPIILWTPPEQAKAAGTITLRGEIVAPDGSHRDTMAVRLLDASGHQVLRTTVYGTRDRNGHQPWHLVYAKTLTFIPPSSAQTWTLEIAHLSHADGSVEFRETRDIRVG